MNLVKWFAIMFVLAVPVIAAWHVLLYLLVRPVGIHLGLYWPTKNGREKTVAERQLLTRRQYIVVEGVLGWGIGLALLLNAANYVGYRLGVHETVSMVDIVGNFVIFPLVGIWYGHSVWQYRLRPMPGKFGS